VTTIDFYTHVDEPLALAARLVTKAWGQHGGVRVLTSDAASTDALDRMLWTQPATGFVPHCRLRSALAADTPIIVDHVAEHEGPAGGLINLTTSPPSFFARFERLLEIVTRDDAQLAAARERYRLYRERGYELHTHNFAERTERADRA
jgi:DNA polymerase-3 subunit chi